MSQLLLSLVIAWSYSLSTKVLISVWWQEGNFSVKVWFVNMLWGIFFCESSKQSKPNFKKGVQVYIHSLFLFIRILFFLLRLNIFIFPPILDWKYTCEYSKIIAYGICFSSVLSRHRWCWSNVGVRLQARKPNLTHTTSCRNAISIKHTASGVFSCYFG